MASHPSPNSPPTPDAPTIPRLTSRDAVQGLCHALLERRNYRLAGESRQYPQRVCRASAIDKCARRMQHDILNWQQRPAFKEWVIARLERGKAIESLIVLPELMRMGFEAIGGQQSCAPATSTGCSNGRTTAS